MVNNDYTLALITIIPIETMMPRMAKMMETVLITLTKREPAS